MDIDRRRRLIFISFVRYLRRSSHGGKTLATRLPSILRNWVTLPHWREVFAIDDLEPHEWVAIEESIVSSIRRNWATKSKKTREAKLRYAAKQREAERQLTLNL